VTSPGSLRRLATAADLHLDRERLVLKQIDEARAELRAEADGLRKGVAEGQDLLAMRGEAARLLVSWDALRERRLREISFQLAELAARRAEARGQVARACGRVIAIRKLASDAGS
jgi:hypothetical protein